MTTTDDVYGFIRQFITSVGVDPATCYNDQNKAYYLTKGSASIEIFVTSHLQPNGTNRNFLRVFCPLMEVPANTDLAVYYRRLLELNDTSLGVKLTILSNSQKVYATNERDIEGLDAAETATMISDLGLWADWLDDQLMNEFGGAGRAPKQ